MDSKQIRANLKAQRDQKFRKFSDKQLAGFEKLSNININKNKDLKVRKAKSEAVIKSKARNISTPFGKYNSVDEYKSANPNSKVFNDDRRIKPHLYYYTDEGPGKFTYETVLYSPYCCLPKLDTYIGGSKRMHQKATECGDEFALKYKDYLAWWRRAKEKFPDKYYEKKEIKREWALEIGENQ